MKWKRKTEIRDQNYHEILTTKEKKLHVLVTKRKLVIPPAYSSISRLKIQLKFPASFQWHCVTKSSSSVRFLMSVSTKAENIPINAGRNYVELNAIIYSTWMVKKKEPLTNFGKFQQWLDLKNLRNFSFYRLAIFLSSFKSNSNYFKNLN